MPPKKGKPRNTPRFTPRRSMTTPSGKDQTPRDLTPLAPITKATGEDAIDDSNASSTPTIPPDRGSSTPPHTKTPAGKKKSPKSRSPSSQNTDATASSRKQATDRDSKSSSEHLDTKNSDVDEAQVSVQSSTPTGSPEPSATKTTNADSMQGSVHSSNKIENVDTVKARVHSPSNTKDSKESPKSIESSSCDSTQLRLSARMLSWLIHNGRNYTVSSQY
jgi:hypothetical protein